MAWPKGASRALLLSRKYRLALRPPDATVRLMLSDTLITALFNTAIAGAVTVCLAFINKKAARKVVAAAEGAAQKVASKVEAVAKDLKEGDVATAQELVSIRETGEKTHDIVNSERTQMLKFSSILARRVANLSGHAEDDVVAKAAEELYRKNLDAQPKPERKAGNVFHGQKD